MRCLGLAGLKELCVVGEGERIVRRTGALGDGWWLGGFDSRFGDWVVPCVFGSLEGSAVRLVGWWATSYLFVD